MNNSHLKKAEHHLDKAVDHLQAYLDEEYEIYRERWSDEIKDIRDSVESLSGNLMGEIKEKEKSEENKDDD